MDKQTIRTEMQLDSSLFDQFKELLFPGGIEFCNPDFLVCSEEDARAGKVFVGGEFPTDDAISAAYETAKKKVEDIRIRNEYAGKLASVAAPYSPEERETWFKQSEAADAYAADGTITAFIQTMADARGISAEDLLVKIKENIDNYNVAVFTLLGEQQKAIDNIWGG